MSSSSVDRIRGNGAWRRENADGSIRLEIHVQPGAKESEVAGVYGDALKIRIAAPPVEGQANAALIAFLAEAFGVPKRNVKIIRGESGRRKTVRIEAPRQRPDVGWGP
ncbi:MAG TPA: DUF167 family protein [Casimicrobiaceae bacterium]|nr:DUF167 family protein [Casimicrobiaceae bacterium]